MAVPISQTFCERDNAVTAVQNGQTTQGLIVCRPDGTYICAGCGIPTVVPAGATQAQLPQPGWATWPSTPGGP